MSVQIKICGLSTPETVEAAIAAGATHIGLTLYEPSPRYVALERAAQLRDQMRDILLHVPGVPPEIFGILESSNRSTIDAAKYLFDSLLIVPRLEFLRTIMQERLIPEFDEKLILDYVSPVEKDREFALEAGKGGARRKK